MIRTHPIYTFDSKGEVLLTIMSSLAQEESRSISENVTWGQRKRFADGKFTIPYKHFLGYKKGANDVPEIVEEEAKVVRRIYRLFLEGKTPIGIAKLLTDEGVPTPAGKHIWRTSTILSILTNEKYKGDALLQKTFCTDFLTKKIKVNEGEVQQYYVENSHPAIVSAEMFDMVQEELEKRKSTDRYHNGRSCLSGKIVCGCCGGLYGSKVWHSTDKYRRVIWQCNSKYRNKEKCDTPHFTEEVIQQKFLDAMNQLLEDREFIEKEMKALLKQLTDTRSLESEGNQLAEELKVVDQMMRRAIMQNAGVALDQNEYNRQYASLAERFERISGRLKEVETENARRKNQRDCIRRFTTQLMKCESVITEFTPELWCAMVEKMTVLNKENICVTFRNGVEITV